MFRPVVSGPTIVSLNFTAAGSDQPELKTAPVSLCCFVSLYVSFSLFDVVLCLLVFSLFCFCISLL